MLVKTDYAIMETCSAPVSSLSQEELPGLGFVMAHGIQTWKIVPFQSVVCHTKIGAGVCYGTWYTNMETCSAPLSSLSQEEFPVLRCAMAHGIQTWKLVLTQSVVGHRKSCQCWCVLSHIVFKHGNLFCPSQ